MIRSVIFLSLAALAAAPASAQEKLSWELGPTGSKVSFRGMHAVSDNIVWIAGANSTVLRSTDGGSSWTDASPNLGELQFRSIHAWNESEACIASAGTPAIILRTEDGGDSWHEVYRNASEKAFFDGLAFWGTRGIAFGDPVDNTLLVVETKDGGGTWQQVSGLPKTREGEAGFAASDSSMIIGPGGKVWIGTGGGKEENSRVHWRGGWNDTWSAASVPIPSRQEQGIFSLAAWGKTIVAVGGDYRLGEHSPLTAAISRDSGKTWQAAKSPPAKFRSAVVCLDDGTWIATGPTGSDYSKDGDNWEQFSDTGFHALSKAGKALFAVGSDGRFAVLKTK